MTTSPWVVVKRALYVAGACSVALLVKQITGRRRRAGRRLVTSGDAEKNGEGGFWRICITRRIRKGHALLQGTYCKTVSVPALTPYFSGARRSLGQADRRCAARR